MDRLVLDRSREPLFIDITELNTCNSLTSLVGVAIPATIRK